MAGFNNVVIVRPVPVAARSRAWVYGHARAEIAGSNPVGDGRADHSSRGVLPSVVCLSVIEELHRKRLGPLRLSRPYCLGVTKHRKILEQLKEYQLKGPTSPYKFRRVLLMSVRKMPCESGVKMSVYKVQVGLVILCFGYTAISFTSYMQIYVTVSDFCDQSPSTSLPGCVVE